MGRTTRFFKSLLGMKNQTKENKPPKFEKEKMGVWKIERRWSFNKVGRSMEKENQWLREYMSELENEQSKHAIAVAKATDAVADAAAMAAQAAVAVVRLSSQGQGKGGLFCGGSKERWAAIKIQSCFRSHLAKKALRALRSLVKLQAHVRGYLVRKRAAATLHSMQALIRAQATVRSQRINLTATKTNFQSEFRPRRSMEKFDVTRSDIHSKRLSNSYEPYNAYEETSKIVEVDTYEPRSRSRRINPSLYDFEYQYPTMSSPLLCPGPTRPDCRNIHHHDYEWTFYKDPRFTNLAQPNGPPTPAKSLCGDNFFGPYSNWPNYMADTKSFRAKLRSQSAPKQRPEAQPKKRISLDEIMAARNNSISGVKMRRSCSQVQATF